MTYEPASLSNRGTRSRAEGDGRSDANQCCDMKADLATIGPEATLKARRCVGPTRARASHDGPIRLSLAVPAPHDYYQVRTESSRGPDTMICSKRLLTAVHAFSLSVCLIGCSAEEHVRIETQ